MRHRPAQKRRVNQIGADQSNHAPQDAAESQLTQWFRLNDKKAAEPKRRADHRPERSGKRHPQRRDREVGRLFSQTPGERLPVKRHVNQMRQRDHEHDGAEIDRQDADSTAEDRLEEQRQ